MTTSVGFSPRLRSPEKVGVLVTDAGNSIIDCASAGQQVAARDGGLRGPHEPGAGLIGQVLAHQGAFFGLVRQGCPLRPRSKSRTHCAAPGPRACRTHWSNLRYAQMAKFKQKTNPCLAQKYAAQIRTSPLLMDPSVTDLTCLPHTDGSVTLGMRNFLRACGFWCGFGDCAKSYKVVGVVV